MKINLYEKDFYQWIQTTVEQIKTRDLEAIDWVNLQEELETLGRSERHELKSRLKQLLEHLLKLFYWEQEREQNERGWKGTIREQRQQIAELLEDSPSLQPYLLEMFPKSYVKARAIAIDKTGLASDIFPVTCPFSLEQVLDENFLP